MVDLAKKQSISLAKQDGGALTKVVMGLGWDAAKATGGWFKRAMSSDSIDLDASVGLYDSNKKLLETVYFGRKTGAGGAIQHGGDNLTGEGEGDDEVIGVDLEKLPVSVHTLVFTVSSFRGQTFAEVDNAFCRLVDTSNTAARDPNVAIGEGKELAKFALTSDSECKSATGMVMATVFRDGTGWKMTAHGLPGSGRTIADLNSVIQAAL
ncbi:TerD family protein [Thalassospira xiamenensis]|uniref:Tellurium resistance protein TerZ n=1 Tax=Thalassospira xiamenensis TaxID=220697 RepID=A0A285TSC4_9PROT|nr:TerD family protein [Thalassospira xiamenensis]SOC26526.1 tellurium resistance protein TerZ [Thalassospira xiamenensis]